MKKTVWIIKGWDSLFGEEYTAKDQPTFETRDEALKRCRSNEWAEQVEVGA